MSVRTVRKRQSPAQNVQDVKEPPVPPVPNDPSDLAQGATSKAKRYINHGMRLFWESLGVDLVIGKREGAFVWDLAGRRYIDALNDGSTYNLGHRNPKLLETLREALETLDIGCQFMASQARSDLAEMLIQNSPDRLTHVHFSASGSEAVDAAIRAARLATRRMKVVSIDNSYHGAFGLGDHASGNDLGGVAMVRRSKRDWKKVPYSDINAMRKALRKDDVAAVIVETVSANIGWIEPDYDYFPRLRELCDQHGAMLIVDEVQVGLGRSGKLWGIENWGIEPDIMVMAKGAGGGLYPLGYALMSDKAARWCSEAPLSMATTFGGSEIGCVVGAKVLEMTTDPAFLQSVRDKAEHLDKKLEALRMKYPFWITAVNQFGLGVGVEMHHRRGGELMTQALFDEGVLTFFAPLNRRIVQFKPPLTIETETLDEMLAAFERALIRIFDKPNISAKKEYAKNMPVRQEFRAWGDMT